MIYATLLVFITILLCFTFIKKILQKYKLKANVGFMSLQNLCLSINNHWVFTVKHVQLQLLQPISFSTITCFVIQLQIRGISLQINKNISSSSSSSSFSLLTTIHKQSESIIFYWIKQFFKWAYPYLKFLLVLPTQWCLFFITNHVQISIQDFMISLQEKNHYSYCLQMDTLDWYSALNVIHSDETPLSTRYTLKQTQHLLLEKQIINTFVLHSLQFNILSSSSPFIFPSSSSSSLLIKQPILSKTNVSINVCFNLASDCFSLYGIHCDILFDDIQTHLYPILNTMVINNNQQMVDSSNNNFNDFNQIQNNLLNKLSTWCFIKWTIKSSKFVLIHDYDRKDTFNTQLELENVCISSDSIQTNDNQKYNMEVSMGAIKYQLKEKKELALDVTSTLLCSSNVLIHASLSHHKAQSNNSSNSLQVVFNLDHPQLIIDVTKYQLLKLWSNRINSFSLSSPSKIASINNNNNNSNNANNNIVYDQLQLLPMTDFSLVLLSPSIQFIDHSSEDINNPKISSTLECTSIRWLISGEYESNNDNTISSSSSPSSSSTAVRRKRSATLIKRISSLSDIQKENHRKVLHPSSPSCIYKMTFWLNIDEMIVKYNHQEDIWIPFMSSKHLDLAFNIQFIPSKQLFNADNIKDGEIQATMEQSKLYICNNNVDVQPIMYWINLIQPLLSSIPSNISSSSSSSLHSDTNPPKKLLLILKIYQRFTANISLVKTKIIMIGKHNHQSEKKNHPPPNYFDNSPSSDITTSVRLCIEKASLEFAKAMNGTNTIPTASPSSLSPPYQSIGTLRFSSHQIVLEHFTSTSHCIIMDNDDDEKNYSTIGWISRWHINLSTHYHQYANQFSLSMDIKLRKYGIQYSLNNHYACILAFNSFLQMIHQWKRYYRQHSNSIKNNINNNNNENENEKNSRIMMDKIQCQIYRCDFKIFLPNDHQLYLRMDDTILNWLDYKNENNPPSITIANMTLLGTSSSSSSSSSCYNKTATNSHDHTQHWEILSELDDIEWLIDKQDAKKSFSTTLSISKLFFRVPHQYQFSNILDNFISLFKGIRELHQLILNDNNDHDPYFTYFGPVPRNTPIVLPTFKLQSNQVILCLDDDPFEARLRNIFSVGQAENAHRLSLEEEFEKEEKKRYQQQQEKEEQQQSSSSQPSIHSARQRLNEIHSSSWIKNINQRRQAEYDHYDQLRQCDYRYRCLSEQLDDAYDDSDTGLNGDYADLFRIHILPFPLYAPLSQFTMINSTIVISQDTFPIDETVLFIHNMGKNVPMNANYSFLIPFQLKWQAGETMIKIRDYPLPLLHVPNCHPNTLSSSSPSSSSPSSFAAATAAWSLCGKYVIADDLGVKEGTRKIPLNIVNDYHCHKSALYAINIVRTASPTKFYSHVDYKVYTSDTTMLCWSVSYQPAVQDILTILENLTPKPVDPSPKIGFWDKIRLMIHTRTKITFVHPNCNENDDNGSGGSGSFALVMKGTRDPYLLLNRGAGMAKYWKDQVTCYLGYENPQKEFIQIQSKYYTFGVPDLIRSLNNNNHHHHHHHHHHHYHGHLPPSSSLSDSFVFTKIVIKLSSGVQMGIGCHLERLCMDHCQICHHKKKSKRCQFLFFKPHYQVVYKSKDQVGDAFHDAYAGFRSDYIHLSISIIKTSNQPYMDDNNPDQNEEISNDINSMHLSPQSIHHFLQWYDLFGGPLSLPVRRGSLFKNADEVRIKFGQHMQSMKYKIMMEPMAFGYFCMTDEQQQDNYEEIADVIGLKANVGQFCLDVHQRRKPRMENTQKASTSSLLSNNSSQRINKYDDNDNDDDYHHHDSEDNELYRVKSNWPLHEIEVHFKDADLRAIYTTNTTVSPNHPSYNNNDDDDSTHMTHFNRWIDLDDFVELGNDMNPCKIASSSKVLPFAFSPCVDYIKVLDPIYVEKNHHLKKTHACIIGTFKNTWETQLDYLHQRMELIEEQIRLYQQKLNQLSQHLVIEPYNVNFSQQERECVSLIDRLLIKKKLLEQYIEKIWETPHQLYNTDLDHSNTSSYQHDKSLLQWESLMGRFKEKYIIHNPQIIWTTAVHDIVSRWRDARSQHYIHTYNISSRATHYLRELVEKCTLKQEHQQQYHHHHHQQHHRPSSVYFEWDNKDSIFDSYAPNELLNKLMDDRNSHFIVTDETEIKSTINNNLKMPDNNNNNNNNDDDENNNDDDMNVVNDPKYQVDQIPVGCASENMTLIDLWNPQIFLQSDHLQDSGILVANQRIQIKQFEVIETDNTDVDTSMVKKRTVASMDAIQLFVVKRAPINIVDLLIDNHYGVVLNSNLMEISLYQHQPHILSPWIPSEMFVNDYIEEYYKNRFERFGNQNKIKGTIQYDRYNPIRTTVTSLSPSSTTHGSNSYYQPWDDQCNSTHLHFTDFSFTANQHQYRILYQVVISILLFKKSPSYIERANQLQDMTFSLQVNGESPLTILSNIIYLQEKVRHYSYLYEYYQHQYFCIQHGIDNNMVDFTTDDIIFVQQQCKLTRKKWHAYKESLSLLTQSSKEYLARHQQYISNKKKLQEKEDDVHDQQRHPAMAIGKINISIKSLIWNMQKDEESPFSQWVLENMNYHLMIHSDQSHHHTFEVDKLLIRNTLPDPVFKQVVGPFIEGKRLSTCSSLSSSSSNMIYPDFSKQKMISGRLVSLKPVGGIPIIQHLEINLFPLQLQLTQTFWESMVMYLFPASLKTSSSVASFQSSSITTATTTTSQSNSPLSTIKTGKSPPLSSRTSSSSSSSLSSTHFNHLLHTTNYNNNNNNNTINNDLLGYVKGKQQLSDHSNFLKPPSNPSSVPSQPSSLLLQNDTISMNSDTGIWFGGKSLKPSSSISNHTQQQQQKRPRSKRNNSYDSRRTSWILWDGSLSKLTKPHHSEVTEDKDDLVIMKQRASNNRTFILIKIPSAKHCLSFKGNKQIYDIKNFKFRQPNLEYRNKTWSWYDLLNALKKDFLKAVIRHSPSLIKEKLLPRRILSNHRENNTSPSALTSLLNNYEKEEENDKKEGEYSSDVKKENNYSTSTTVPMYSMAEALESRISFASHEMVTIEDLIHLQLYSDDDDDESTFDEDSDEIYGQHDQQDLTDDEESHLYNDDSDEDLYSLHSNDDYNYNDHNDDKPKNEKDHHHATMVDQQKNKLFEKTISRWISLKKGKGKVAEAFDNNNTLTNNEYLEKGKLLFGKSYKQL